MTRYLYLNSTRSSHVVEKRSYGANGEVKSESVCLCGEFPRWHPDWPLSFQPTRRLCKTCQMVLDWREKVMQRKYRVREALQKNDPPPWRLAKGTLSSEIGFVRGYCIVTFRGFGLARFSLRHIETHPDCFECIYDPTMEEVAPLPLFTQEPA